MSTGWPGDLIERPSANPSERAYQQHAARACRTCRPSCSGAGSISSCGRTSPSTSIRTRSILCSSYVGVAHHLPLIREIAYVRPDARREVKAARYLNWRINRQVNAEDTVLIARVQQGMASRSYVPGPLGESEVCLRSFARKLRRLIPEANLHQPPKEGWSRG